MGQIDSVETDIYFGWEVLHDVFIIVHSIRLPSLVGRSAG